MCIFAQQKCSLFAPVAIILGLNAITCMKMPKALPLAVYDIEGWKIINSQPSSINRTLNTTQDIAYISGYSGDSPNKNYFVLVYTLGYNLMMLDPNTSRVLIISPDISLTEEESRVLNMVWTEIKLEDYVVFPLEARDKMSPVKTYFHKLKAFTQTKYKKLLWVGSDTIWLRNPHHLFSFPAPAGVVDYHLRTVHRGGPTINGDCFLFEPSMETYNGIVELSSKLKNLNWGVDEDGVPVGPLDQSAMNFYFAGEYSVFPYPTQVELQFLNIPDRATKATVSVHYPCGTKPHGGMYRENFTELYCSMIAKASEFVGVDFDMKRTRCMEAKNGQFREVFTPENLTREELSKPLFSYQSISLITLISD